MHADLAPEFYHDPGNVNLDLTFYPMCLWEFMTPNAVQDILELSWRDYGSKGEKSSHGPMNFRGNVGVDSKTAELFLDLHMANSEDELTEPYRQLNMTEDHYQ